MTARSEEDVRPTVLFLTLYCVVATIGSYLAYLSGLVVEGFFGSGISMIYFLTVFAMVMILAFPLAMSATERLFARG